MFEDEIIQIIDAKKKNGGGFLTDAELQEIVDAQKASSWPDVESKLINGKMRYQVVEHNRVNVFRRVHELNENNHSEQD
jgi:hypothetical protein